MGLGENYRNIASQSICISLAQYVQTYKKIGFYHQVNQEVNVFDYAQSLLNLGDNNEIGLPFVSSEGMIFRKINSDTQLLLNKWRILEPEPLNNIIFEPEMIIVPILGFDKQCNRLGYGGGFYDKFLKDSPAKRIGVAFSIQEVWQLPAEEHDIKMDLIITEKNIIFKC